MLLKPKLFTGFIPASLVLLALTGCSQAALSDKDVDSGLVGQKYACHAAAASDPTDVAKGVISFTSSSAVTETYDDNPDHPMTGQFTVSKRDVTLKFPNGEEWTFDASNGKLAADSLANSMGEVKSCIAK
jgi:hypothetical protein